MEELDSHGLIFLAFMLPLRAQGISCIEKIVKYHFFVEIFPNDYF
jgi:hypothetical protein